MSGTERSIPPSERNVPFPRPMMGTSERNVLFRVDRVTKRFVLPRTRLFGPRSTLTAVDDLSFELRAEETLGIVGESGSGKTTLVKLLLGLETPDSGTVTYL